MASKLRQVAKIQNVDDVKRFLYGQATPTNEKETKGQSDWDMQWDDWNDGTGSSATPSVVEANNSWLQECIVSLSPACDMLVLARENRAVFLQARGPADLNGIHTFSSTFSGVLENAIKQMRNDSHRTPREAIERIAPSTQPQTGDYQDESETITAVLCIPIASQKRSNLSLGAPDWTVVTVGFSTGFLQFYTEQGTLLTWQLFTERPARVVSLRLRSYSEMRAQNEVDAQDELTMLLSFASHNSTATSDRQANRQPIVTSCSNLLVVINGLALLSTLNAARSALARHVAASGASEQREASVPQLAAKKFSIASQMERHVPFDDHVVCGTSRTSLFEQLRVASFPGGFQETVRSEGNAALSGSLVLMCGARPSFAFYVVSETASPPLLDLTVHAVSKLRETVTSSFGGLFGLRRGKAAPTASSQTDAERAATLIDEARKRAKTELAAASAFRSAFVDERRVCSSVALSVNSRMVALVDRLGRVLLVDARTGCVVRVLKGARDGRCGWLQICEASNDSDVDGELRRRNPTSNRSVPPAAEGREAYRTVHCVVLYAPRRKVIELFLAASGPRVAAFSVSGFGTLLYAEHTLLGLNASLAPFYNETTAQPYFLDERGQLFSFQVPFAIAANSQSAERFLDLQTLKRIGLLCDALAVVLTGRAQSSQRNDAQPVAAPLDALVQVDANGTLTVRTGDDEEYIDAESAITDLLGSIRSADILLDALRQIVAVPHLDSSLLERVLNVAVCANPQWNPHCNRLMGSEAQSLSAADFQSSRDADRDWLPHSDSYIGRDAPQTTVEDGVDNRLLRFSRHHLHLLSTYQFFTSLINHAARQCRMSADADGSDSDMSANQEDAIQSQSSFMDNKLATSLQSLSSLEESVRKLASQLPVPDAAPAVPASSAALSDAVATSYNDFTLSDLFNHVPFDKKQNRLNGRSEAQAENLAELRDSASGDRVELDAKFSAFLFATYFDKLSLQHAIRVTDDLIGHCLHIPLSRPQIMHALVTFWLTNERFSAIDCHKLAILLGRLAQLDSDLPPAAQDDEYTSNGEHAESDGVAHDTGTTSQSNAQTQVHTFVQVVHRECAEAPRLVSACSLVHVFRSALTAYADQCVSLASLDARLRILVEFKSLLQHNIVHGFDVALQNDTQSVRNGAISANDLDFLQRVSVNGVLRAGKGAFTELFSKSLAAFWKVLPANAYLPAELHYFFINQNVSSFHHERFQLFVRLAQRFPHSFERNNVLLNVTWELLAKWHRDFEDCELLTCAIDLLKALHTPAIIGGTVFHCNAQELIWRVHFARTVADLTSLVDKQGRMPAERVLRKTLVLGDRSLRAFLTALLRFFELYVENVRAIEQPGDIARLDSMVVDIFTHDLNFFETLELQDADAQKVHATLTEEHHRQHTASTGSQGSSSGTTHSALRDSTLPSGENEHVNLSLLELLQEQEIVDSLLVETRRELIHCLLIVAQLRVRIKPSALFRGALLDLIFAQPKMKLALQRGVSKTDANSSRLLAQSSDDADFDYDLSSESDAKSAASEFDWRAEKKTTLAHTNVLISADMQKQRYAFLESAIVQSAKLLADEYETATLHCAKDDQLALSSIVMRLDGVKRAELILDAARLFQCDVDMLRRRYVAELYAVGLDRIALAVRNTVEDRRALRGELIPIIATRLALLFATDISSDLYSRSSDDTVTIDALRYRFKMRVSLDYYLRSFAGSSVSASKAAVWKGTRLPSLATNFELLEFLATCGDDLHRIEPRLFEIYEIIAEAVQRK